MPQPRKPKLGQNFLVDQAACRRIAEALGDVSERTIVEIGPGHGAITALLAPRCRRLIAIELDRSLAAELAFRFREQPSVEILEADVLKTDLAALSPDGPIDVIGNLPYYITSDILLALFRASRVGAIRSAVVMMQREVADRVAAPPGSRTYGLLSATAQMYAKASSLFTLPPSAFSPPPDVYSTVVRLDFAPRFDELQVEPAAFDRFLHQVFAQKRKTLTNNLRHAGFTTEQIAQSWPQALSPQVRAEDVPLGPMAALHRSLLASQLRAED